MFVGGVLLLRAIDVGFFFPKRNVSIFTYTEDQALTVNRSRSGLSRPQCPLST